MLYKRMIAYPGGQIGKKHVLATIKSCVKESEGDRDNFKRICIYYAGHSNK